MFFLGIFLASEAVTPAQNDTFVHSFITFPEEAAFSSVTVIVS